MATRIFRFLLALGLSATLLAGCSGQQSSQSVSDSIQGGGSAVVDPMPSYEKGDVEIPSKNDGGTYTPDLINEQKLIRQGSITLRAKSIDTAEEEIRAIAARYNGYIFSMRQSQTSEQRYLDITLKVENTRFEDAMNDIKALGTATIVSMDVSDVTKQFIDTETRIKTLKLKEETLNGLLGKATKIDDILTIENNLQQTRQEIESYEGQLNVLRNATELASITVNVRDAEGLASTSEPPSAGERFSENLSRGLRYWSNVGIDVLSGLIFLIPVLIPIAGLLILLLVLLRFTSWGKQRRKGKQERLQAKTSGNGNLPAKNADPAKKE